MMDDDELVGIDDDFLAELDNVESTEPAASASSQARPTPQSQATAHPEIDLGGLSDAFSDDDLSSVPVPAKPPAPGPKPRSGLNRTSSGSYRQTTLWGREIVPEESTRQPQASKGRMYLCELQQEKPTHHELDGEALKTWVYPTNLGAIRDYQYSIVKNSLFNNTLVALPTGLGKTFIAATVMLNFYRWTKTSKIVFVAPTKPLVAQQVDACYNIVGIPRSDTTLLTGDIQPALRVDEWNERRVFFMTPQTLLNDLSHGYADPKQISLLVIDEAHRAVGEYAYAKVTKMIRRFSESIRVLALTATPGSKVETVQEVIDNLGISHCEIRTEESLDIRQYVHQRHIEQMVLDPSDEMNVVMDLFTQALKPLTEKLTSQNIWYGRMPMAMTAYGLMQAQREWFASRGRSTNQGVQNMMRAIFSVLTSIAHSIKLLNFHGIKPFFDNMVDLRQEQEAKGEKGPKYRRQLIQSTHFQEMMRKIEDWMRTDGFVGHPKLTALADCVLNHFMDQGENSSTRVIVFSEFRDSAEAIVRMLNTHRPLIKASVFVGQADGKRGEGMKQAQQIKTIEEFRQGVFNVLVATSIGEEGLDIGQVDLIVCYDASASPIRMLQRMGRTGRKRAGRIVLLLMRGKEEDQFAKSKDNYEKMQQLICEGSRFNFRFDLSKRIVPRDIRPEVDKRHIEIPIENTQDPSLPEPKKRRAPAGKKKPPKKFHMPDGVETGFQTVTDMLKPKRSAGRPKKQQRNPELDDIVDVPALESVMLAAEELKELNRSYRDLPFSHSVVEETDMPSMTSFPELQRELRPTVHLKHGRQTKRWAKLFRKMGTEPDRLVPNHQPSDISKFREVRVPSFVGTDGEEQSDEGDGVGRDTRKRSHSTEDDSDMAVELPKTGKKRKTATPLPAYQAEAESDDGEATATRTYQAKKPRKTKKGKRRPKARGRGGINSDEVGDDCERDSDLMETDGSDDGADLADFLVSDSCMPSSAPAPPSSLSALASPMPKRNQTAKPFYVPTEFPGTQESEGMPDLQTIVGATQPGKAAELSQNGKRASARAARSKRNVVEDSDSE
ncbi:ATP-dependent DNA helicase mph1 [Stachybotrys elegans]|uniref:ATP-dependent DNA helicase n=1 Tax=Stachybotrys elegans TaxID=80388 RepID=A0A8K0T4F5_9HYPO|nr:ATP-dependent DNA helicase mph1 [Stachybotrys elegans]